MEQVKTCNKCHEELPLSSFSTSKQTPDGYRYCCKPCAAAYQKARRNNDEYRARRNALRRDRAQQDWRWSLRESARGRASKQGVPFDLSYEDIVVPTHCPILGIPLVKHTGKHRHDSPTLDKIIPELGYVPGNVQVISFRANSMKNDATPEELLRFANYIQTNYT